MQILRKTSDILHSYTSVLAGIIVSVLTVLSVIGVIFRFVFDNPIVWLYELSLLMFSWIIFLGVAMAFKVNEHMNLTFIVDNLKPGKKYLAKQIIYFISLIFMVICVKEGFSIAGGTMNQYYNTIPVPKGIFYLSLPISAIPSIIHIILHMLDLKAENTVKISSIKN